MHFLPKNNFKFRTAIIATTAIISVFTLKSILDPDKAYSQSSAKSDYSLSLSSDLFFNRLREADSLMKLKQWKPAIDTLTLIVKEYPDLKTEALWNRANCYEKIGNKRLARRDFEALKLEYSRQIKARENSLELEDRIQVGLLYWHRGDVSVRLGDNLSAYSDLKRAKEIRKLPTDSLELSMSSGAFDIYLSLGDVCYKLGKYSESVQYYGYAVVAEPESLEAQQGLKLARQKLGKPSKK